MEDRQTDDRAEVESKNAEVARTQGGTAAVADLAATTTRRPAPAPLWHSLREETVASLSPLLPKHDWLELTGSAGVGKTELARLLAEAAGGIRAWLDFRSLDPTAACVALDAAVRSIAGEFPASARDE